MVDLPRADAARARNLNELLSRLYRELAVNLLTQVIRGGLLDRHRLVVGEHEQVVAGFEARDRAATRAAITRHIESVRQAPHDAGIGSPAWRSRPTAA